MAGRHVPLDRLWGSAATDEALERLQEAVGIDQRRRTLETILMARRSAHPGLHPAVAFALRELPRRNTQLPGRGAVVRYWYPLGMLARTSSENPEATHSHCAVFQWEKNRRFRGSGCSARRSGKRFQSVRHRVGGRR